MMSLKRCWVLLITFERHVLFISLSSTKHKTESLARNVAGTLSTDVVPFECVITKPLDQSVAVSASKQLRQGSTHRRCQTFRSRSNPNARVPQLWKPSVLQDLCKRSARMGVHIPRKQALESTVEP